MAADAAALIERVLAKIQSISALGDPIVCVTHLASGFGVLFMKQRVQPERIQAVGLHHARRRPAIAAVTGRATEFLGIVNLQKFFAWMTNECLGQIVGPLAGTIR